MSTNRIRDGRKSGFSSKALLLLHFRLTSIFFPSICFSALLPTLSSIWIFWNRVLLYLASCYSLIMIVMHKSFTLNICSVLVFLTSDFQDVQYSWSNLESGNCLLWGRVIVPRGAHDIFFTNYTGVAKVENFPLKLERWHQNSEGRRVTHDIVWQLSVKSRKKKKVYDDDSPTKLPILRRAKNELKIVLRSVRTKNREVEQPFLLIFLLPVISIPHLLNDSKCLSRILRF